jgi:DNA-binding beta-propeller fold protein YncE
MAIGDVMRSRMSAIAGVAVPARQVLVGPGCRRTAPTVTTGAQPQFVAVDQALHTAFAINQDDGTLSAINTRTCGATATSGCRTRPRNEQATFNPAHGFNPNAFALIHKTGAAYLVNVGGASIVSVVSVSRANAIHTSGCRKEAPSIPDQEFVTTVDPATDTIYAGNLNLPQIDVINGAACNAAHLSGCAPVAEIPMADPQANVGDIDQATHTFYASDPFSDTVSIIDTATCNAAHTAGCPSAPPTVAVGPGPGPPALDPATKTLYVPAPRPTGSRW